MKNAPKVLRVGLVLEGNRGQAPGQLSLFESEEAGPESD